MSQDTERIARDLEAIAKRLKESQELLKNSELKVADLQAVIDETTKLKAKLKSGKPPSRS